MSDESKPLSGGCHCGAIRYTVTSPLQFTFVCHCDDCRKLNGGCRMAGATIGEEGFAVEGELAQYDYQGGKAMVELSFCKACGTPVSAKPKAYPGMLVVRANTFDDDAVFAPMKPIFDHKICAWDRLIDRAAPPTQAE